MGFRENSWNCLGEIPANFQKPFFRQRFYRMCLIWYYYLRVLKKLEFWGLLQNYMGIFGKQFQSFQNRFIWQSFCSMIFQHSNGKNAQNFSGVSNFFSFLENRRVLWKKLDFLKKLVHFSNLFQEAFQELLLLKISQNEKFQNLGFLVKVDGFFSNTDISFLKAAAHGLVFLKSVSSGLFGWDSS